METESRAVAAGAGRKARMRALLFHGHGISFGGMKMFRRWIGVTAASSTELHPEKELKWEFPLGLGGLRTKPSLREDAGWIPGLAQWVKDLVLAVSCSVGCTRS